MGAKISPQRNKIRKAKRKHDIRREKAGNQPNCVTLPLAVPGENTKVFLSCMPCMFKNKTHAALTCQVTVIYQLIPEDFLHSKTETGPCAMAVELGAQQAHAEGQYVQPAWAVSRYGARTARSSSTCAGFLACGRRSQAASGLSPTWTENVQLEKRDAFKEIWIVIALDRNSLPASVDLIPPPAMREKNKINNSFF